MKKFALILCLAVSACVDAVPVSEKFPEIAPVFLEPAPALKTIPAGSNASDVFDIVVDNYGTYHEVVLKLKGWQDWYSKQKAIFDELNGNLSAK